MAWQARITVEMFIEWDQNSGMKTTHTFSVSGTLLASKQPWCGERGDEMVEINEDPAQRLKPELTGHPSDM
jgi:hypothetical protein